jgi:cell division protein FtsB
MQNTLKQPANEPRKENTTRFHELVETRVPTRLIPVIILVTIMGIFYVGLTHRAERLTIEINKLEQEVETLRADYISKKANLMKMSKQSSIARRARAFGLEENTTPPQKIITGAP